MDIGRKLQKIGVLLAQDSLVTPLEKMTPGLVFDIEVAGVAKLEALHQPGKWSFSDFNQQVNVVGHQCVGI